MRKRTMILVAGLFAASTPLAVAQTSMLASAEQYSVRVEYRKWKPTLTGLFRDGLLGSLVDPVADLGIPEDEDTFQIHGAVRLAAAHKLRAGYTKLDYKGEKTLDRDLIYSGSIFRKGDLVASSLKGALWTGGYEFDFVKTQTGFFGVVIGAAYLDVDGVVAAPESGIQEAESTKSVLPTLGLSGRLYASKLSVTGDFAGMYAGDRGYFMDADASARFHFSDRVAAQVGYRYLKARGVDEPDLIEVKLQGLTYGVEVSF